MQLVLDTKGITVKKRNNCFFVYTLKNERIISPSRVESIAVTSHCTLTSSAIRLAITHGIPIYFIDNLGKVEGRLWTGSFGKSATLRRQQVMFVDTIEATEWIKSIYKLKFERQIETLKFIQTKITNNQKEIENTIIKINNSIEKLSFFSNVKISEIQNQVLGIEGSAAKFYFQQIANCLPAQYKFSERSRQPAKDIFNALLNYIYGMLYGLVETAIFQAGLDPYLGIFHADIYNKPTLSFDLIEPFRPWADNLLLEILFKSEIRDSYFENSKDAVTLTKEGKAFLIPCVNFYFSERILNNHKNIQRKTHIIREVYSLVNTLKLTFQK